MAAIDPEEIPLPRAAYLHDAYAIEKCQEAALNDTFGLSIREQWWQDQSELLLQHGYKVRRRFRAGWTPSWLGNNLDPNCCEDSTIQYVSLYFELKHCTENKQQSEHAHSRCDSNARRDQSLH